jgi:hypothetical protein
MIKGFHFSYGLRLAVLQCICRTGVHIELWGARLLRRPDVGHLRIFGCLTFSHVPSEKRTKLDPTTEKGILVGYSEVSKAYQIYIPALRREVRFEEDRAFRRSCELRDRVEEVPQMQDDTPSSGGTSPPNTATGSWGYGTQTTGSRASGFQTSMVRYMDETKGHEGTAPQEVT